MALRMVAPKLMPRAASPSGPVRHGCGRYTVHHARTSAPAHAARGQRYADTIRAELYGMTAETFRAERLNLWVDELGDAWLPPGVWARQAGPPEVAGSD